MVGFIPRNNTSILINEVTPKEEKTSDIIADLLGRFMPITLAEMDGVKLMNRVDTKFLVSAALLPRLLERAVDHYRVVEINSLRSCPYSSIYFDTPDAAMYTMHHNGKRNRYKIRLRSYVDSGLSFLEIKRKNNKGRTSKKRIKVSNDTFYQLALNGEEQSFIRERSPYVYADLQPNLQNFFHRITLVDKRSTERITIDTGLKFRQVGVSDYTDVNGLIIVEMKQDGAVRSSFRDYLDDMSVKPVGMSKYCLGMIMTDPCVKSNRFKKKIRYINKITEGSLSGSFAD